MTISDDRVLVTGAGGWDSRYIASAQDYDRAAGLVYQFQLRTDNPSGNARSMWGLKNVNDNFHYNQMPYAVYFNNTTVQIYESGSNRGSVGTQVRGTLYDIRITTKAAGGALYEWKEATASDWLVT